MGGGDEELILDPDPDPALVGASLGAGGEGVLSFMIGSTSILVDDPDPGRLLFLRGGRAECRVPHSAPDPGAFPGRRGR